MVGWILFDPACQPYFTLITTFIFAPYFASAVAPTPAEGQSLWGFATGAAGLVIAVCSPILGAVADASGRRKPWIAAFGLMLMTGAALLWFAVPGDTARIPLVLAAFAVGTIGVEFATVFNNAIMPDLVPPERLGRLSGIATATRALVRAVEGTRTRIVCTRKTTPGLRVLEKHAVRLGGGFNHRFGLDDAVLVKDNHIAVAGGIRPAVERVRAAIGHMVKVEVEVDTLAQLEELLTLPVDVVLLDNMDPETLRRAVAMVDGRMVTEASGNVTLSTVRAIAESGVDMISVGWLTHSAPNLDIGLDM